MPFGARAILSAMMPCSVLLADDFILDAMQAPIPRMAQAYDGGAMVATMQVPPQDVSALRHCGARRGAQQRQRAWY